MSFYHFGYLQFFKFFYFVILSAWAGIHIHFSAQSSAGQVSLMAYLPGYNLGCLGKSAELYKRIVKKLVATWKFLISKLFPLKLLRKGLTKLLSTTGAKHGLFTFCK